MFVCKLCGHKQPRVAESSAHKGMCKQCYSDTVWYNRMKDRTDLSEQQQQRRKQYEDMCRFNLRNELYVPKGYLEEAPTIVKCSQCGKVRPAYKNGPSKCEDCGRLESRYRNALSSLRRQVILDDEFGTNSEKVNDALDRVRTIELEYLDRYKQGYDIPRIAKRRLNIIEES